MRNLCPPVDEYSHCMFCRIHIFVFLLNGMLLKIYTVERLEEKWFVLLLSECILLLEAILTLLLLNTTCPVLANSVDPDQLVSEEAS